jgi:hypothetical protein
MTAVVQNSYTGRSRALPFRRSHGFLPPAVRTANRSVPCCYDFRRTRSFSVLPFLSNSCRHTRSPRPAQQSLSSQRLSTGQCHDAPPALRRRFPQTPQQAIANLERGHRGHCARVGRCGLSLPPMIRCGGLPRFIKLTMPTKRLSTVEYSYCSATFRRLRSGLWRRVFAA